MGRYKIEYKKQPGDFWQCLIHDRKNDKYAQGYGDTKKEALNDAWDDYYENSEGRSNNSTSYEPQEDRWGCLMWPLVGVMAIWLIHLIYSQIIEFWKSN